MFIAPISTLSKQDSHTSNVYWPAIAAQVLQIHVWWRSICRCLFQFRWIQVKPLRFYDAKLLCIIEVVGIRPNKIVFHFTFTVEFALNKNTLTYILREENKIAWNRNVFWQTCPVQVGVFSDSGAIWLLSLMKLFCTSTMIRLFSGLALSKKGSTWGDFWISFP